MINRELINTTYKGNKDITNIYNSNPSSFKLLSTILEFINEDISAVNFPKSEIKKSFGWSTHMTNKAINHLIENGLIIIMSIGKSKCFALNSGVEKFRVENPNKEGFVEGLCGIGVTTIMSA
tara:strand:+ start:257 stop:622 length:366 start_codon:yes stop_codon:yes gene_type:complete